MTARNNPFLVQLGRPIPLPFSQALFIPLLLPERALTAVVMATEQLVFLLILLRLFLY